MAILEILHFPDERLRQSCLSVEKVDQGILQLIDDMFETMYDAPGIGLAAIQVNVHKRLLITDVSRDGSQPMVFINPEILDRSGEEEMEEGCLSVPGYFENVTRAEFVKVRALNRQGEAFELEADGLLAVCLQHEIDHLDGKLFVDYISPLKRERIQKKLSKLKK